MQQASTRESGTRTDTSDFERLSVDELDYITMAVTMDVSDLSPPRVNYLIGQAVEYERAFTSKAWGKGAGVSNEEPSEQSHADGRGFEWIDAETAWMDVTVDVSDLDGEETGELMEIAERVEDEFLEAVTEYAVAA